MPQDLKKITIRFIQTLVILIPVGLFFWLANIAVVPSGSFETTLTVGQASSYIDRVLPEARVETPVQNSNGEWQQKIVSEPVFFLVHPQRSFEEIKTQVRFKNTGVPIVELGILADATNGAFTLQPLQNLIIDNSPWLRLASDGVVLLQREKKFAAVEDFLKNLPAREQIATYHYGLKEPYRLAGYQPSSVEQTLNVSLRGPHDFLTYIKDETLCFDFSFSDANRQVGEDTVILVVINEAGQPVAEVRAEDNGLDQLRSLTLQADGLPEGVYKIQMKASEDIFFRSIKTNQQKITFVNQLWLADEIGFGSSNRSVSFLTEGKTLKFATHQASGAQSLIVGSDTVKVVEPFVEYVFEPAETGTVEVVVPKVEDLLVRTNGHFAFSSAQYFNPDPVRLTAETDLDRAGVNYIIAEYTAPKKDGEWLVAETSFDAPAVSVKDKTWKFVLSLPTVDQADSEFWLNKITLTFLREPITWQEILNKIRTYVF